MDNFIRHLAGQLLTKTEHDLYAGETKTEHDLHAGEEGRLRNGIDHHRSFAVQHFSPLFHLHHLPLTSRAYFPLTASMQSSQPFS